MAIITYTDDQGVVHAHPPKENSFLVDYQLGLETELSKLSDAERLEYYQDPKALALKVFEELETPLTHAEAQAWIDAQNSWYAS